jgi:hypothetical protein
MKCFVIQVIIGATGIVSKSVKKVWKQYLDNIQQIIYKIIHSRSITYHVERATVWDLKTEWWGSPLAQEEKYQEKENLW